MSDQPAFIFARGGSKGIKDKNIREAGGKPLLGHAIAGALASKTVSRVVVSTDSDAIAEVARKHGAGVLMRPAELASDSSPELLSWRHAVENHPPGDLFISLPATSPLRAPEDVDAAVARFRKGDCDIVFGVTPARHNPYLNMAVIGPDNLIKIAIDGSSAKRRQDVPEMYDITTCVYVASPDFVMKHQGRLIDGRTGCVIIPSERALDIDEEYELHLADLLLRHPFRRSTT